MPNHNTIKPVVEISEISSVKKITKREQLESIYRQSLISLIIHILKTLSSKETPLSIPEITNELKNITLEDYNANTIRRHIDSIVEIFSSDNTGKYANMKNAFIYSYGGIIYEVSDPYCRAKVNSRNKYYFDPLLSAGDVNMLCASVTSNRYISKKDKDYLNTRLKTLSPYCANTIPVIKNIAKSNNNKTAYAKDQVLNHNSQDILNNQKAAITKVYGSLTNIPKNNSLLNNIQQLDDAISEQKQITMRYGIYTYDDSKLDHLKLTDNGKEYNINPYALCWNNGSFYLICTNAGYDIPYHFRVDRILEVNVSDNKAEKCPDALKPYFKGKEFLVDQYTKTHPYMSIYGQPDIVNCTFEIPSSALSILVDYFGQDIRLELTGKETSDRNGKMWPVLKATIENVEYPCLKSFTIQHHQLFRVLSPERLINDLKEELTKSLQQYD